MRWIGTVLSLVTVFVFVSSCTGNEQLPGQPVAAAQNEGGVKLQGRFIHTVLFWVREDAGEAARRQLLEDCRSLLGTIDSVRYLAAGPPAGTPREVVDNSYAVGLVVHFDDQAGHDFYQDAPKHQQFIERNQAIWERVQVYDILVD